MYNNQDEFEDIDDFGVIDDQLTHNQEVMNEIDEIHKSASERRRQRKAAASRNARANDDEGGGGESIAENAAADTAEPLTAQGKRSATEGQSTNKT